MKLLKFTALILICMSNAACASTSVKTGDIPDVPTAEKLRGVISENNELEIAKSFVDSDPTFVLGSVVNTSTGQVQWQTYLKSDAEPKIDIKTELWEQKLVEKNLAASASYLSFISGSLTDKKKAEVILIKNSVTKAKRSDIDFTSLKTKLDSIPSGEIANYGLIVQYTDFVLTATLFEEAEKKADAKGYGAKISGKWHNKVDNKDMDRVVVATFFPLKDVLRFIDEVDDNEVLIESLNLKIMSIPLPKTHRVQILDSANKANQ
ncbi:hypothetical protein [Zobellella aerophila]|uniref:Lipoprotein n=1 Tax=Zobellella aerophila TaxID=870480 RepID=A0ABP6V8U6_9GAMM